MNIWQVYLHFPELIDEKFGDIVDLAVLSKTEEIRRRRLISTVVKSGLGRRTGNLIRQGKGPGDWSPFVCKTCENESNWYVTLLDRTNISVCGFLIISTWSSLRYRLHIQNNDCLQVSPAGFDFQTPDHCAHIYSCRQAPTSAELSCMP